MPQCGIINLFYEKHKILSELSERLGYFRVSRYLNKVSSTFANSGINIMEEERNPWLDVALEF